MKTLTTIIAAAALTLGVSACEVPEEDADSALDEAASEVEEAGNESGGKGKEKKDEEQEFTPEQDNAIRAALDYLDFSSFSRKGLIGQLSSRAGDGYPKKVARFAVNQIEKRGAVDWNAEAVEAAESYLEFSTFSCNGLVQQLSSKAGDQFTAEQARHGATEAGIC